MKLDKKITQYNLKYVFLPLLILCLAFIGTFWIYSIRLSKKIDTSRVQNTKHLIEQSILTGDQQRLSTSVEFLKKEIGASEFFILDNENRILSAGLDKSLVSNFFEPNLCKNKMEIYTEWNQKLGIFCWSEPSILREIGWFFPIVLFLFGFLFTIYLGRGRLNESISKEVGILNMYINQFLDENAKNTSKNFKIDEFEKISLALDKMINMRNELYESKLNIEKTNLIKKIANQVAHDIQSPIMSLKIVADNMIEDSKAKDLLQKSLERIQYISDDLLKKHREASANRKNEKSVFAMIETIITEKRASYTDIHFDIKTSTNYIDRNFSVGLERVLSNIIQNAIEALDTSTKEKSIIVMAEYSSGKLIISIIDNGKGIPTDILPKLFQSGATFNKENGTALA